jgi:hypothetical protein
MNNEIPTTPEAIEKNLLELENRINKIKKEYSENDGRFILLSNLRLAVIFMFTRIHTWITLRDHQDLRNTYSQIIGLIDGDLNSFLHQERFFIRLSSIVMFQFQIETLFKNIITELDDQKLPYEYNKIVKRLLEKLKLDTKERRDILNILAYIRNCFHSNGIHTKSTITISIDNELFEFIQNKPFTRGDYGDICFILDKIITVLNEILTSDKVKKLDSISFQHTPEKQPISRFDS